MPLVPGYHEDDQDGDVLKQAADSIGIRCCSRPAPAVALSMRIVDNAEAFDAALLSFRRGARASFGDDRILIEKYLLRARHIEIQLFADMLGN